MEYPRVSHLITEDEVVPIILVGPDTVHQDGCPISNDPFEDCPEFTIWDGPEPALN